MARTVSTSTRKKATSTTAMAAAASSGSTTTPQPSRVVQDVESGDEYIRVELVNGKKRISLEPEFVEQALAGGEDGGGSGTITGPAVLGKLTEGEGLVVAVPVSQDGDASSIVVTDSSSRFVGVTGWVYGGVERLKMAANGLELIGSLFGGQGSTATGLQAFAFGLVCVASGPQAIAMGNDAIASGDRSISMGYNVTTTKTYGVSLGANLLNDGTAAVQLGENLTNAGDSANASQMGFQQTVNTNSPFATLLGAYVYLEANNTGAFICGYNASGVAGRPGQFQHSSGCEGFAGTGWIDMVRTCVAVAAPLRNVLGGSFPVENYTYGKYEIDVLACTDDAAKTAHETLVVYVKRGAGGLTIETPIVTNSTMAAAGWSVSVAEGATGVLEVTGNPGAETVKFGATFKWTCIRATYGVA